MKPSRGWWVAIAAVIAVAACSDGMPSRQGSPSTTALPAPTTVEGTTIPGGSGTTDELPLDGSVVPLEGEELLAPEPYQPGTQVEALLLDEVDGVDAQFAVEYFNLAFGGMPGATEPYAEGLPNGDASPERATALAQRFHEELTPDQQRRLGEVLAEGPVAGVAIDGAPATAPHPADFEPEGPTGAEGPEASGPSGSTGAGAPSGVHGLRAPVDGLRAPVSAPSQAPSQGLIDAFRAVMVGERDRMARLLPNVGFGPITVDLTTKPHITSNGAHAFATADLVGQTCAITVYPELWRKVAELGAVFVDSVVTHELFHCAQFVWANGKLYSPEWLIEGSADFVEQDLWRAKLSGDFIRTDWFTEQSKPLAARNYDAWGLYESIKSSGYDPYTIIEAMVRAKQTETEPTLRAGGLDSGVLAADWGTRSARPISWTDRRWNMTHPAASASGVNDNMKQVGGTLGVGSIAVQGSDRWSHKVQLLSYGSGADMVRITNRGKGIAAVSNQKETFYVGVGETLKLCLDPAICVCPPDTETDFIPFGSRKVPIAFQASAEAGLVSANATKWNKKKDCEPPLHRGSSDGDPHLVTFDGVAYDLMSVGEFVLAKSGDSARSGFEVQIRTRPAVAGSMPFSLTTAVAMRLGGHEVSFTAADFTVDAEEVVVRGDGAEVDVGSRTGVGGLTIRRDGDRFAVTSEDVEVGLLWDDGFFVEMVVPADVATSGLLGSADRDPFNDLILSDGVPVLPTNAEVIHGRFADEWRVTEDASLMYYGPGESTATFTDKAYPGAFEDLSASGFADARATCHQRMGRAATSVQLDQCAFDMVASGGDAYLDAYAAVVEERSVAPEDRPEVDENTPEPPTTTLKPGAEPSAAGEPVAVVSGVLLNLADPDPPEDAELELTQNIEIAAGSMLIARTECRADQELGIELNGPRGGAAATVLCGAASELGGVPDSNDSLRSGEFYWWLPTAGTYELTVEDVTVSGGESREVSIELFADPEVEAGEATSLAEGWTERLEGIGDTAWVDVGPIAEMRPLEIANGEVMRPSGVHRDPARLGNAQQCGACLLQGRTSRVHHPRLTLGAVDHRRGGRSG
jgi:hypothetical protein